MAGTSLKRTSAVALALAVLAAAAAHPGTVPPRSADPRPNIVLILTDDQSFDTLPSNPPAMPWLQSQIFSSDGSWLWFPNAFISTPLCCPSRATILTGRYSHHTGVLNNDDGHLLDETQTVATWLHAAGYTTGLVGKYLNEYPFDRGPYVPPGWDTWVAKRNVTRHTTYYGYPFVAQEVPYRTSPLPEEYATDFLASRALSFLETAPTDRPYFLYFAPSAPHGPITPAPRDAHAFDGVSIANPPSFDEANVSDKPGWVRSLPPFTRRQRRRIEANRRAESATLYAVDDAVREIVAEIAARGDLQRTVVFFLTDNGFSFGAHRWVGKACPYEECIRTPFAVRFPGAQAGTLPDLVSNVDLAPTIADLARATPTLPEDGEDLVPLLDHASSTPVREGVLIEWAGGGSIPAWTGVRTANYAYIEDADGTVELYDLAGRLGPPDPGELTNRAGDPRYAAVRSRLASLLGTLLQG